MATYYVAIDGNNSSNGSSSSPWKTISYAMQSNLKPGDEVIVRPGTYNEAITIDRGGSTAGEVTLKSEIPGEALIRPPSSAWNGISVNANYVTIDGFDIKGARGDGVEANNVHHIKVLNNTVSGSGESGIQFNWSDFITIEGNETFSNASSGWFSGISIYQNRNITGDTTTDGYRTIVRNNVSYDNITKGGQHTDGNGIIIDDFQHTQAAGFPSYAFRTLVENNLVYENGGKGIALAWSDNVTVRNNTSWHNNQDKLNTGTWRGELSNQDSKNNVWVNNIAVADTGVNANNTAIGFYGGGNSGTQWFNNITFNGNPGQSSLKLEGGNNPAPTAANGNKLGIDPLFVNSASEDFHLRAGSPAINAGTDRFGIGAVDLDGDSRAIGTVDIGADEVRSSSAANQAPRSIALSAGSVAETSGAGTVIGQISAVDPDGDAMVFTVAGDSRFSVNSTGKLVVANGANLAVTGDQVVPLTLTANDGKGGVTSAGITVTILDTPAATTIARNDAASVAEDDSVVVNVLANDAAGATLTGVGTAAGVAGPAHGTVAIVNGAVRYTPFSDYNGADSFQYVARSSSGTSATARVDVTVTPVDDAPAGEAGFSLWNRSVTPARASDPETKAVEVGVKFQAGIDGEISSMYFYKGAGNDGPHTAKLWTTTGEVLVSVAYGSETAQGWQKVDLDRPLQISAGETYIASYHAPKGKYSISEGFFAQPLVSGPLTATAGVYAYGAAGSFPTGTWKSSNYWVDLLLEGTKATHTGGGARDVLNGGATADVMLGKAGNDSLFGNDGDDMLRGQAGNDFLRGSAGSDILIGGTGADSFMFAYASHSPAGAGRDEIRPGDGAVAFQGAGNAAGDLIDVKAVDANTTLSGDQTFVFGSTGKGGLSLIDVGGNTLVRGNIDNSAAFEFELLIIDGTVGASAYTAADFVL